MPAASGVARSNENECTVEGGWSVEEMISISRVNEYWKEGRQESQPMTVSDAICWMADLECLTAQLLGPFVPLLTPARYRSGV